MADINNDEYAADYRDDEEEDFYGDVEGGDVEVGEEDESMEKRVEAMQAELDKLNQMQQQVDKQISTATDSLDEKSIYVGQVDYETNPQELKAHFAPCGTVSRVTIICDKFTGQPKGLLSFLIVKLSL
jgi:polyadenylate-binding protein 2